MAILCKLCVIGKIFRMVTSIKYFKKFCICKLYGIFKHFSPQKFTF
jgi:hypothetical protein